MTTSTLLTLLFAAAGLVACAWVLREHLRTAPVEVRDDPSTLLGALDLAEVPAAVWCPETQELRANATTRRLMLSLDASCDGDLTQIPARHVTSGEQVTTEDLDFLADGTRTRMAVWLGDPDDTRVALEVTARPVREGQIEVLLIGHDVTAEHSAIETRGDLVATLSHDMRSALTSTIGYVALVTDDPTLPAKHRHSLDIALKGVNQTLHLMADLRAAREPGRDAVQLSVEPRPCDLATVLGEALASLRPAARGRRVSVSVDAPETVPLHADPLRMRQVLDNLLLNAVKHNQDGGWVDIVLDRGKDEVTLTVTNTGATLTAAEQERVFDRYFRAESSRRSRTRGLGLGLSVVKDVVVQHGGTVEISSAADLGTTTLSLVLPIAPAAQPAPDSVKPAQTDLSDSRPTEEVNRAARADIRADAVAL